jgi:hypothetical protein
LKKKLKLKRLESSRMNVAKGNREKEKIGSKKLKKRLLELSKRTRL